MIFETPTQPEEQEFPNEANAESTINAIRDKFQQNNKDLFELISTDTMVELQKNTDGRLIGSDGEIYADTPRMGELIRIATLIKISLPPVPDDFIRLWRGNRDGEVGLNPSYTNSLEGIALPFLMSYKGPLSYIDVPKQDLGKYLTSGAKNSEFILPKNMVKNAHIVGMSDEEANKLKSQSKPDEEEDDLWTYIKNNAQSNRCRD